MTKIGRVSLRMSGLFFFFAFLFLLAPLLAHAFQVCPVQAYWTASLPRPGAGEPPKQELSAPDLPNVNMQPTDTTLPVASELDVNALEDRVESSSTKKVCVLVERDPAAGAAVIRRWLSEES